MATSRSARTPLCSRAIDRITLRRRAPPLPAPARQLIVGSDECELESQLPAADVVLNPELLHRIDQIVASGVAINPADTGYPNQTTNASIRLRI
jgi:hypothetical protein